MKYLRCEDGTSFESLEKEALNKPRDSFKDLCQKMKAKLTQWKF